MARQLTTLVHREQTVESAFNHILRTNLASIERSEPVALVGKDIEGVHDIRVGLRRIRSALTVFRPVIPCRVTKPLAKDLRWAAKELDRARDLDVYIARNLSGKKSQAKMRALATKQRDKAYQRVRHLLKGKRYRGVKVRLGDWLDANTWHTELSKQERKVAKRKVAPFASHVLEAHRLEILKKGRDIRQLDSEALHRLRLKCKKLRYATEFFEPVYGAQMKPFTKQLKEIQELLGTLHDIAVMTRLQQDLIKDCGNSKLKRAARKLEAQGQREAEIVSDKLIRCWKMFSQTKRPW